MPLDAPVTTATLPASLPDMAAPLLEFSVPLSTMKLYEARQGRPYFIRWEVAMPSGRGRQCDAGGALDRAREVFRARGYEGATLPELTRAMGINRPSLYAAFGNKEQLFRKAVDRYQTGP